MKILTLLTTIILSSVFSTYAQDVQKPKNINISEFDDFKNASFGVQEDSGTLLESITTVESEIQNYSGVMNTMGIEKLRNNYKALKDGVTSSADLSKRLTELTGQSSALMKKAKSAKPMTKRPAAAKNTQQSMKALDVGKGNLTQIQEKLSTNIGLLATEMTSRGELIE